MKNKIQNVFTSIIFSILIIFFINNSSLAQEDGSPVSIGTYRNLYSQILNENRTLLINLPRGYNETNISYPVLYILYGGQVEGYFAEAVHIVDRLSVGSKIPEMIIIGVKNVDRYRDNLPINRNGEPEGAENFLKFFKKELIPFIDQSYRTKDFRILLGPQAGATFSVYALIEEPDFFKVNIITNPFWITSIREYMLTKADEFFNKEGLLKNFLFISSYPTTDSEAMLEYLQKFKLIVEKGKRSDFTLILNTQNDSENDVVPPPGLREGLKTYFKEYKFPAEIKINRLEDLQQYYQKLSQKYGYEVDIPEFTLIRQGDGLEERQKLEEAKILYEYVMVKYPHDLNSYNRLGDLHRTLGDYKLSIKYYKQFLERNKSPIIERKLNSLETYINESAAYVIEEEINNSGIGAGIAKYRQLRSDNRNKLYFSEDDFNSLGYNLITRGKNDAAIEVFEMNVEMNPQSANAYNSLGEAYMLNKNKALAIKNYKKSLELDPDNSKTKEMLRKLEKSHNEKEE
jgi:tetratricopeptide (TPR) repeat protein